MFSKISLKPCQVETAKSHQTANLFTGRRRMPVQKRGERPVVSTYAASLAGVAKGNRNIFDYFKGSSSLATCSLTLKIRSNMTSMNNKQIQNWRPTGPFFFAISVGEITLYRFFLNLNMLGPKKCQQMTTPWNQGRNKTSTHFPTVFTVVFNHSTCCFVNSNWPYGLKKDEINDVKKHVHFHFHVNSSIEFWKMGFTETW